MEIEFAITKEIINESLPLHYRHAPFKQRFRPFLYPVVLLLIGVVQIFSDRQSGSMRWFSLLLFFAMAILYTIWYIYQRNNAGKRMIKLYGENTHYKVEANEDGMVFWLSYTTSENKWPAYQRAVISKHLVLIYQQNGAYIIFHETFFANDDFSRFKDLVRKHMHEVKED